MRLVRVDVARRAISIGWPLVVADSALSIAWIVDTYFVGGLGSESIAAVGAAGYLIWLYMVFSTLVYMGVLVILGQAIGSGNRELVERASGEGLTLSIILSIVVCAAAFLVSRSVLRILAPEVEQLAWSYLSVSLLTVAIHYLTILYDAVFRALGKTMPILYSSGVFTLANTILDPILIYGHLGAPALGVEGAAWASVAASLLGLLVLVHLSRYLDLSLRPLKPSSVSRSILSLGFPSMVERVVFVVGNVVYLGSVSRCGAEALAAHTIGVRIESLAFLPLFSIATASGVMVGWEVGAGKIAESKSTGWELIKLSSLVGLAVGVALAVGGWLVTPVFTSDPEVAWLSAVYLVIAGLTEPLLGVVMVAGQIIRNAGDTRTPTLVNLGSLYLLRVIPAYLLPGLMPPGLCVLGAWLAMAVDILGRAAVIVIIYLRYYTRLARRVA
ncbi:MATE family efflux transporter [Aeropyrum camini]|uniref:Multidrug-efflux transporter n=1 Tax=Aeropyrum camini SY1 = JCM 12091 TaxID=1198449 RepID=U3TDR4_9CREN|nr:MATE family efflux transporter [Aeropyrum camini]BAN90581.1 MatE efflux family protein [Aeropyrum camini SY1 = JCM 12091]